MSKKKSKTCNSIKEIDLFGERAELTFRNKSHYSTWPGTIFSCAVMTLFLAFFVIRTIKIATGDDPFFSMTTMEQEGEIIDLHLLDNFFAIEDLDPRVGRISVSLRSWGTETGKSKTNVDMVDCRQFLPPGQFASQTSK